MRSNEFDAIELNSDECNFDPIEVLDDHQS